MYVLGIDAGGTKTVCLLADETGRVAAEARGGGANLQASGELQVEKVLHRVMEDAIGDRDIRPSAVCLGIAGVDRADDADAVRGIMRRLGFKTRTLVVNDALIALVAGAGDNPGVVVIAGTGSIAYGRDAAGRAARAGGWGYLLGDEGGGFWIGRSALAAVVGQYDGGGPATQLTHLVLEHLKLGSPAELIPAVYDIGLQRRAIAAIASLVHDACAAGDAVAADILSRAATELSAAATSVITRLEMRGDVFPTILSGGIFHALPSLAADVVLRLLDIAPRAATRVLDIEPAAGAVHLALAAARGPVTLPTYI
jgi:N-acetylglucosamine kinase-like BadF-type ATPase